MTLVRWRPTRDFVHMKNEFDRLFGEFLSHSNIDYNDSDKVWSPRVDVFETEEEFLDSAELTGVRKEDVKVTIQDNVLSLIGKKRKENEEKDENIYRREPIYGDFKRSIPLPGEVKANKIQANFKDGVLKITLPKTEEAKIKEIQISVN